ncbi:MAG: efflux transporter periplasmic adaptor subunit, partial [Desulfomonilaceae bacterium]
MVLQRLLAFVVASSATLLLLGCDRQQQSAPPPIPEVTTMTIQPQRLLLTTELPGRTSAYLIAEIRPQINGIIQKRLFTEGSDVKTDQ